MGHVESRGIENFCFVPPKLVPKHFNSRFGVRNLLSLANMATAWMTPVKRPWSSFPIFCAYDLHSECVLRFLIYGWKTFELLVEDYLCFTSCILSLSLGFLSLERPLPPFYGSWFVLMHIMSIIYRGVSLRTNEEQTALGEFESRLQTGKTWHVHRPCVS